MVQRWSTHSPDGAVTAELTLSGQGELALGVVRDGRPVIEVTRLGMVTAHADLTTGLAVRDEEAGAVHEEFRTLIGARRDHTYEAAERTLRLTSGADELELQLRVSDHGVAFRYSVRWRGPVTVTREATSYRVAQNARAVLLPYDNGRNDYEEVHLHSTVAQAQPMRYGYPALFATDGGWVLVTESDLDRTYAGSRLLLHGDEFALELPDPYVTAESPLVTPWRTLIVGELADIVSSDLVTSLAAPSRIADTSWVQPGTAAWSWWSDEASPSDFEKQRAWVDFAAAQGWAYVLVDEGWGRDWAADLVAYARDRGVGIWVWSHWQHLDSELEFHESLALWKQWGIVGVKIDFTESDGQDRMRWFDAILEATAALELMIIFHGGTIPRGTERTWPHFMTAEAVKGAEWLKPGRDPFPPTHYVSLAFTRNVQGPMDFTPVTFTASRSISAGFELALSVIYTSGVQHFADSMDAYLARPEALRFLGWVPAAWDETRLLSGDPADHIVVARRRGADWFVGAGTVGAPREVDVDLGFLGDGTWTLDLLRDGHDDSVVAETRVVTAADACTVAVAANGGFALRLSPATEGL